MDFKSRLTDEEFSEELAHAEETTNDILALLNSEVASRNERAKDVTGSREYFIDYFREMHNDEREDWLQFEYAKLKQYDKSVQTIQKLGRQLAQPYFGKVVFQENGKQAKKFYIGIYSLMKNYLPAVIDWRAPVSSLYYESEPGEASYTPASGEKKGILSQKRRFTWREGNLAAAANISLPNDDEFLREILSENSSDHLKVIVQSLQKDQNMIVRDFVDGVHVIAGCAGSGKSSVAMHKIAFIMYSFREKLKNKNIVVLSPNVAFSNYISHILPDLGEDNVFSLTQEELVEGILIPHGIQYSKRDNSMERMLTEEGTLLADNTRFKNSSVFLRILDKYAAYYATHCFKADDIEFENGDSGGVREYRLKKEDLDYLFNVEFDDVPVAERVDAIMGRITVKNHISNEDTIKVIRSALTAMLPEFDYERIYRSMFTNEEFRNDYLTGELAQAAEKLPDYNIPVLTWEDAVAAAYLVTKLTGAGEDDGSVFYLFCDEAQDLSPAMLGIIKACYGKAHMLFAGDLNQNVFANSEDYAEMIRKTFAGKHFKKYELKVNYRSTKEISEFAREISGRKDEMSCVRTGKKPEVIKVGSEKEAVEAVNAWVEKIRNSKYERCCVLAASKSESDRFLEMCDIPGDLPRGMLHFLPVYLAKGLEFDAVLVLNVGGSMQKLDEKLGTNMLYTAATRAMHELCVIE